MKYHHLFLVNESSNAEEASCELSPLLSNIYELADPNTGAVQIGGYSESCTLPKLTHSCLESSSNIEEMDWQAQWAAFAPGFKDGLAHIDLGDAMLLLKPGGGFGDFSHPTTRLMIALMTPLVKDKTVFDIGCGSGILSLAAALLGAKQVFGIDIEQAAIQHSRENALLNQLESKAIFSLSIDPLWAPDEPCIIVMNMIASEQIMAWQTSVSLHPKKATVVASGVLATQRDYYLNLTKSWGWTLLKEQQDNEWLGFIFSQN